MQQALNSLGGVILIDFVNIRSIKIMLPAIKLLRRKPISVTIEKIDVVVKVDESDDRANKSRIPLYLQSVTTILHLIIQ